MKTKYVVAIFSLLLAGLLLAGSVSAAELPYSTTPGVLFEITESDTYTLSADILEEGSNTTLILISADDVILDGNWKQITGGTDTEYGILAAPDATDITIQNFGNITDVSLAGISIGNATDIREVGSVSISNVIIGDVKSAATNISGISIASNGVNDDSIYLTNCSITGSLETSLDGGEFARLYGIYILSDYADVIIDNCVVSGSLSGNNMTYGIYLNYAENPGATSTSYTISNSLISGHINGTSANAYGIVMNKNSGDGFIENCIISDAIIYGAYVNGIRGEPRASDASVYVQDCRISSDAVITGTTNALGMVANSSNGGVSVILRSAVEGTVTAKNFGYALYAETSRDGSGQASILDSYVNGNITGRDFDSDGALALMDWGDNTGGTRILTAKNNTVLNISAGENAARIYGQNITSSDEVAIEIIDNTFAGSDTARGLYFQNAQNYELNISGNTFETATPALWFASGDPNGKIYNNNFSVSNETYVYNATGVNIDSLIWNETPTEGTNIAGGEYIAGNWWGNWSDTRYDPLGYATLDEENATSFFGVPDYHPLVITGYEPGTPENPFKISDAAGLKSMRNPVNLSKSFEVEGPIDLNNENWEPIGNASYPFTGTFNGNYHTISGLSIIRAQTETKDDVGLFGYVNGSTISNLTLEVTKISVTGINDGTGTLDVGGIVGWIANGSITNSRVIIQNEINASHGRLLAVGGIAGYNGQGYGEPLVSIIENCSVEGNIVAVFNDNGDTHYSVVGGIAGVNEDHSYIINSRSSGKVTGYSSQGASIFSGGVAGSNGWWWVERGYIQNCSSDAYVLSVGQGTDSDAYAGGIAGWNYYAEIDGSYFEGTAQAEMLDSADDVCIGGIVGWNMGADITNSYVIGDIVPIQGGDFSAVGGIAGYDGDSDTGTYPSLISSNYVLGNFTATFGNASGILGYDEDGATLENNIVLYRTMNGDADIGRVAGYGTPALTGNYGWNGTTLNGNQFFIENDHNGTSVTSESVWNNQSFYQNLGWNFSGVWKMNDNISYQLPVLEWQTDAITLDATYLAIKIPTSISNISELPEGNLINFTNSTNTSTLSVNISDQFGNLMPNASIIWNTTDENIISIDQNGTYIAHSVGDATLTATSAENSSVSTSASVTVFDPTPVPSNISSIFGLPTGNLINLSNSTNTSTLSVNITDQYGNLIPDAIINWNSTNSSVISIDQNGTYTVHTAGTTTLSAASAVNSSLVSSADIIVFELQPDSVPTKISIFGLPEGNLINYTGSTFVQLSATVYDQFENIMYETPVVWSSTNSSVISIDQNGTCTVYGVGTAILSAKADTVIESAEITVYQPIVPHIPVDDITKDDTGNTTITPNSSSDIVMSDDNKTATITDPVTGVSLVITYSDGATVNSTGSVTGHVNTVTIVYPEEELITPSGGAGSVILSMNVSLNDVLTELPVIIPAVNETKRQAINNVFGAGNIAHGAMVDVESHINDNITKVILTYIIPKTWVEENGGIAKLKVIHTSDDETVRVVPHDYVLDGEYYIVTVEVYSFSAYSVIMDHTPVNPVPIDSGADDGRDLLAAILGVVPTPAQTAPLAEVPTVTETLATPVETSSPVSTQVPATVPETVPQTPTPSQASLPLAGIFAGILAAAVIGRRK